MFIIERFEDDKAVLEDDNGKHSVIIRKNLPHNAKEGDCLILKNGVYSVDSELTKEKREEIIRLQDSLWE